METLSGMVAILARAERSGMKIKNIRLFRLFHG
jgi:hypothetical protein